MTEKDNEFIGYAISRLATKRVTVIFENSTSVHSVREHIDCSGFFDDKLKVLAVACKKARRDFFPVFVHEYYHFIQWELKQENFTNLSQNQELEFALWKWLDGELDDLSLAEKSLREHQAMELDCERRTIKAIENFGLSIYVEDYIKAANIYVLFYNVLLKTKKWYDYPPYENEEIVGMIPSVLMDTYITTPPEIERAIINNCYKRNKIHEGFLYAS